jgi:hypothetical protein
MSTVISISTERRYGVARVCRVWGVGRAGIYRGRRAAMAPPAPRRRPGPVGAMSDADLVEAIRQVLADSPFHGEGFRKVWARLRHAGLRTSKEARAPADARVRPRGVDPGGPPPRPAQPRRHDHPGGHRRDVGRAMSRPWSERQWRVT